MTMQNIKIEVMDDNYIVVRADTMRFGDDAVMFEGNTFDQCFDYIKRETGREKVNFTARIVDGAYTDRTGRTFPVFMRVTS